MEMPPLDNIKGISITRRKPGRFCTSSGACIEALADPDGLVIAVMDSKVDLDERVARAQLWPTEFLVSAALESMNPDLNVDEVGTKFIFAAPEENLGLYSERSSDGDITYVFRSGSSEAQHTSFSGEEFDMLVKSVLDGTFREIVGAEI